MGQALTMTDLLLRRVSEPRPGAEGQDDYDVIGDVSGGHGLVIGRIFRASTAPAATPWMWTESLHRVLGRALQAGA
jgi:hypothetical protein